MMMMMMEYYVPAITPITTPIPIYDSNSARLIFAN
jgi:hypothetical protein